MPETMPRERALRLAREKIEEAQLLIAPYRNRSRPLFDARGFLDFAGDRIDAAIAADYCQRRAEPLLDPAICLHDGRFSDGRCLQCGERPEDDADPPEPELVPPPGDRACPGFAGAGEPPGCAGYAVEHGPHLVAGGGVPLQSRP